MKIIKFNDENQTSFAYLDAYEREVYYNGSNRRMLEIIADINAIGVDALNLLLNDEGATSSITLTNDSVMNEYGEIVEVSNIYDGYILKASVGVENKMITEETTDTPAVYGDRLVLKLGKRTYIEQQLANLGL